jgi:hypothetical protein
VVSLPHQNALIYTLTRLLPAAVAVSLWLWLRDGNVADPANFLLLFALLAGVVGFVSVRRYWHVRNTSRSRRDSSLLI